MPRKYELKRRAQKQEETRQRIIDAVVELHEELGPVQTTISAIAEKAGVQRLTVYRHFPDEPSIFRACRDHWISQNPLPDPEKWREIRDPMERMREGLAEVFAYHSRTEKMQANILRDAELIPALAQAQMPFLVTFARIHEILIEGLPVSDERRRLAGAVISHALSFSTWRSFIRDQGLSADETVELLVCMAACAAGEKELGD
ncbi:TetR family transcriptional regulator [soil metagenome]